MGDATSDDRFARDPYFDGVTCCSLLAVPVAVSTIQMCPGRSLADACTAGGTANMLAAIAAQETGHIWGTVRDTLSLPELLEICVGDTLDADRGRSAFPKTKAERQASRDPRKSVEERYNSMEKYQ